MIGDIHLKKPLASPRAWIATLVVWASIDSSSYRTCIGNGCVTVISTNASSLPSTTS